MSDPTNPLTEPKRLPARGKRVTDGLIVIGLGVAAWVLFFLIDVLTHIRFLPLPVIGLLMIAAGLYWIFAKNTGGAQPDESDS